MSFSALVAGPPVLTDGAWGTELQARGLRLGECADTWNVANPDAVAEVARKYIQAGSEVILTNTFRSNALSLKRIGLSQQAVAFNRRGADLSRNAAAGRAHLFGSMGPVGESISTAEDLRRKAASAFGEQAQALADGGVDALVIETMTDIEEAKIAVAAALRTDLPVVVSFAFATGGMLQQAAAAMQAEGASAVGANCCDSDTAVALCRQLRAATTLPIWLKPSAGLPVRSGGQLRYKATPEDFGLQVPHFIEAGAAFIGGCCGAGPEFIMAAARRLGKRRSSNAS